MKSVVVVAGILCYQNRFLCCQRNYNKIDYLSKKWEFPGGKIEDGESKEEALHRELLEELNVSAKIKSLFLTVIHAYPDFELTMHSFLCEVDSEEVTLNEHLDYKWLDNHDLSTLDWAAADIPIVDKLILNE
jgi:8-oxo-dGTP diphosphatase